MATKQEIWNNVGKRVSDNAGFLIMLRGRWQDEMEYEDWDEYIKAIKNSFVGLELHNFRKSPFGFSIKVENGIPDMVVKVKSGEVSWGMK